MEIKVLGPLLVQEQGVSIVPSAGKPRQILALLALRAGRVVPAPVLMEEIWGEQPPRSATTTLQTYILQLRRKIASALVRGSGRCAKDVLKTCYGGYRLDAAPFHSDLTEFERRAGRGGEALETGDAGAASLLLAGALDLWRGPGLVDVPTGQVLSVELIGMEEARLRVLEQRIEADLRLGRHAALLSELRMLVARHPMNESLCAQFMLALYRSGNAWRALEAYQQLRGTLIGELGIEPSSRTQRLHRAMLSADPSLELPLAAAY
ncbi:AfsR/SARP family transcriptional regulator [Streptomyces lincolnensis]|uniref:AfsR/SARP family transcriptional regulator n=1 Tax=Streptomyces lincolnensis TaxID=1915 RepID=UPI001E49530E|nr:AfsR/SARP family transcriptional regulator [Streptomyces lincolnensis]MCD7439428.1 AfsR/SARP family transcriptional regulator [Streptomyces lincolnensis]